MRVIVVDKNSKSTRAVTLNAYARVLLSLCLLGVPAFVGALAYKSLSLEEQVIDKNNTMNTLTKIIQNDGDLRSIKHALSSQKISIGIEDLFIRSKDVYYPKSIPLSSVLEDIRVNAILNSNKEILVKIDKISREYEEVNPFDKLQPSQRDFFINIRIKSEENYTKISNDINNIVDELDSRNKLVGEYLSDSKISFWISIAGLLLSLAIGCIQIYLHFSSKKIEVKFDEEINKATPIQT